MLSEDAVYKQIRIFEEREDAFSLILKGVCIWRIVRSIVFHRIQNVGLSSASGGKKRLLFAAFQSLVRALYFITFNKDLRYAVVSYPFALRSRNPDGSFSDFYYQEIIDTLPGGVRLSNDFDANKREVKRNTRNLDLTFISLLAALLARIIPVSAINNEYQTLSDALRKEWEMKDIDACTLKRWFSFFWWESKLKGTLFSILGIEVVITINSGEYSTVKACVDKGIRVIELQHGIYTRNHPDVLTRECIERFGRSALFLPNIIALYGDYWVGQLGTVYEGTSVSLAPVGYAACDVMRRRRNNRHPDNDLKISVLVTTQGFQRTELICFIKEALKQCSSKVLFFIKPHPVYDTDIEDYLREFGGDRRVEVVSGNDAPTTSDLLTTVDLHVSIASACHYDALSIGLPTIVLNLPGNELVYPLVEEGRALFAENPLRLAQLIEAESWGESDELGRNYYAQPNFLENIVQLLSLQAVST